MRGEREERKQERLERKYEGRIRSAYRVEFFPAHVFGATGPGWYDLLDDLIENLLEVGWSGEVAQVKEKFGGLRFYVYGCTELGYELIYLAEEESFRICENCGAQGKLRGFGWLYTSCDEHALEEDRDT